MQEDVNSDLYTMQEARQAWDDLVEQVRDGARADEVLGLQEPREKLSKSRKCGKVSARLSQVVRSSGRDWR